MNTPDKCPHCGAELRSESYIDPTWKLYACGTSDTSSQTAHCRERAARIKAETELAATKRELTAMRESRDEANERLAALNEWVDCHKGELNNAKSELSAMRSVLVAAETRPQILVARVAKLEGLLFNVKKFHPVPWYLEQCNAKGVEVRDSVGNPVFMEFFDFGPEIGPDLAESITGGAMALAHALVAIGQAMPAKEIV